ncbi:hypothetical protein ACFLU6_14000 [Acidobacteriota bacterium]
MDPVTPGSPEVFTKLPNWFEGFDDIISDGSKSLYMLGSGLEGNIIKIASTNISIKPGGSVSPVNPKSQGKIKVAILSNEDYYAPTDIVRDSLTFGRTGNEKSLIELNPDPLVHDVNRDGVLDLVVRFDTEKAGFQPGDWLGILKGLLIDGTLVEEEGTCEATPINIPGPQSP